MALKKVHDMKMTYFFHVITLILIVLTDNILAVLLT